MQFDRLNQPVSHDAWGEGAAVNGFAEFWDRELFGIEVPEWRQSVVKLVEHAYHAFGQERVVVADMGCGAATYARHLLAKAIPVEYHGYDHNEAVLAAACERWRFLPYEHVHLHLMDARAPHWPVSDDAFDALIWDTTLRFCEDLEAALQESARTCRGMIILARTPLEAESWREEVRYYGMDAPSANWHFSEERLEQLADAAGLTLHAGVGCLDTHVLSRGPLPMLDRVKSVPRLAQAFHAAYVQERVARLFAEHNRPWVIYGAGAHTRWLLGILPEELRTHIFCLADDAPAAESIVGIPVLDPSDLDRSTRFAVLVSSDSVEDALYRRALLRFPPQTPVYRLYANLPAGPYEKPVGTAPAVLAPS